MTTYLIHKDGVLCPDYGVFTGDTKQDATLEFIGDDCETPEGFGLELVEYLPADKMEASK